MSKRTLFAVLILIAMLASLLAGCGATPEVIKETVVVKETEIVTEVETVQETVVVKETQIVEVEKEVEVVATPTTAPEPEDVLPPMKSDPTVFTMPSSGEPGNIDPDVWYDIVGWETQQYVYEGLVTLEGESTTEYAPKLAESWEISDDGLVYTFHLREGVQFHDGTPFNAEAVKYNFERRLGVNAGPAYMVMDIEEMVVLDEYTLEVTLGIPLYNFMSFLTSYWGPKMLSPSAVQQNATDDDPWATEWARTNAVGTGPFKLERWTEGQEMVLTKFEDYWGGWDHPHVETVLIPFVQESATRRLMLEGGDADMILSDSWAELEALAATDGLEVVEFGSNLHGILQMNTQAGPLADPRVREAMVWAFDYETVINDIGRGHILPADSIYPRGFEGYEQGKLPYSKDLDKAKALLEEAGYGDGFTVQFTYLDESAESWRPVAQVYKQDLAQIGVNLELREVPISVIWDYFDPEAGLEMFVQAATPDASDPFSWVYIILHSEGFLNFSFYSNSDYDAIIEEAMGTNDEAARLDLWKQAADIIIQDNPLITAWQYNDSYAKWHYVKGLQHNPTWPQSIDLYHVYKEE